MKITYAGQTISFFDTFLPSKILLSLSGGLDSACLFFLICKHFPDMDIIPFTAKNVRAPFDAERAEDITQWMKERFPKNKILSREEFTYDHFDEFWLQQAKIRWKNEFVLVNGKSVPRCNSIGGLVKMLTIRHETNKLREKYSVKLKVSGQTSNPPVEEQKKYNFYNLAERRRDGPNDDKSQFAKNTYSPFIHVNKKFIADFYKKNDLMKTLYPLTGSCIGSELTTDYFTKECRDCFWCHEKKWAFNLVWN
jgi:hypothetical protein